VTLVKDQFIACEGLIILADDIRFMKSKT